MKKELLLVSIFLGFLLNLNLISAPTFQDVDVTNDLTVGNNANVTNNLDVGGNTTSTYGFFDFLGSATSRIMEGWFTKINAVDLIVDTNTLFVDSANDRVGIGTTTPQNTLDVVGDTNISNGNIFLSDTNYIEFGSSEMRLKVDSASYGSEMLAFSGESVLFGIVAPDAFHMYADVNLDGSGNWEPYIELNPNGDIKLATTVGVNRLITLQSPDRIRFYNGSSDVLFADMSSGNVGLGTSNPQNTLNIIGDTNSTGGFIVGPNVGVTANYSVGTCWIAFSGGIAYSSNCTEF